MDSLRLDLRLALRSLTRRPVFSLVAILSVALGVGFSTAVFSSANALLLRPVPGIAEPERVVDLGRTSRGQGHDSFSWPDYVDLREAGRTLERLAAYRLQTVSWAAVDQGVHLQAVGVTSDFFPALGVQAARGRLFGPEAETPAAPAEVVVSHAFWRDQLGGDPEVVGRVLRINRTPFTVIGVTPEGFSGHIGLLPTDVWLPFFRSSPDLAWMEENRESRRSSWFMLVGRLAPGATVESAGVEVRDIMARLAEAYPESNAERSARVIPLGVVPGLGQTLVKGFLGILGGLVTLILLLSATNVAGMLLARSMAREKEMAVRLAVGAGRPALVRQLVVESSLLFLLGGGLGLWLAVEGTALVSRLPLPAPVPLALDLTADGTVAVFALGLALVTGLGFGLIPALQATRPDLVSALRQVGAGVSGRGRLQEVFAAAQVGISLVLLVAAGLLLRSLQEAAAVDAGFDPEGVHVASLDLALEGYDEARGLALHDAVLDRLRALPGVTAAGLTLDLPMDLSSNATAGQRPGAADPEEGRVRTEFTLATPGTLDALGVPLLRGRDFGPADGADAPPVILVNRTLAEQVWPGEDALGKTLRVFGAEDVERTVVGVLADTKNQTLTEAVDPMTWVPYAQRYQPGTWVVVRGGGVTAADVRREVLAVDPALALGPVQTLEGLTSIGILPQRVAAGLAGTLGVLALLLSALGVYGVIALSVVRRRRELGIRLALGATSRDLLALVVRAGIRVAVPGLVLGLLAALGAGRLLRSLLVGISPLDPVTFLGVGALLLAVVVAASWIPGRRATRVQPVEAMGAE